jgi:uncharacterized protein YhbP (UPF0306 family)
MNIDNEAARTLIEKNLYVVISTSTPDGEPWISPVFFAHDERYRLYWVSNKDAKHSRLIRENPSVAAVIFNSWAPEGSSDADGVYFAGIADELSELSDVQEGIETYNAKATKDEFKVRDVSEVTGDGAWRIYRMTPNEVSKLGPGKIVNGQYKDERVSVTLL